MECRAGEGIPPIGQSGERVDVDTGALNPALQCSLLTTHKEAALGGPGGGGVRDTVHSMGTPL